MMDHGDKRPRRESRLRGIRSFFTSDRSSRNAPTKDKMRQNEANFPSISPLQLETGDAALENYNSDVNQRLRASSLREPRSKQLISVETNLRCVSAESRSAPSTSCGSDRSSSPWLGAKEESRATSATKAHLSNDSKQSKGTQSLQLSNAETSLGSDEALRRQHLRKSLSCNSRSLEKEDEADVFMYTNSYDFK